MPPAAGWGGAGAPLAGNTGFALRCVDAAGNPAGAASAWILGTGPAAPPVPFCGAVLLIDPTTWLVDGAFGASGTLRLGTPATTGLGGVTSWLQTVHLSGTCLASGDAMSMTVL